jgi:hypothetical protein
VGVVCAGAGLASSEEEIAATVGMGTEKQDKGSLSAVGDYLEFSPLF